MNNIHRYSHYNYLLCFFSAVLISISSLHAQNKHDIEILKNKLVAAEDTVKVSAMLELMKKYSNTDFGTAIEYGNKALRLSRSIGYDRGIALSLNSIGGIYNLNGKNKLALLYYKKALSVRRKIGNKKEIAASLNNIGKVYSNLGDYPAALKYLSEALSLREKSGSQTDLAESLNDIGYLYLKEGKQNKALNYYKKALVIRKKTGSALQLAGTMTDIGKIYTDRGDYEDALNFYVNASRIQESINVRTNLAATFDKIGMIYSKLKNYNFAAVYLFKSLEIRKSTGSKRDISQSMNDIAVNFRNTNNLDKSISYSKKSLSAAKECGAKDLEKLAFDNLARSYAKLKNYEKAYYYQNKIIGLSDTLYNINKLKQLSNLETGYESDKSELQIKLQEAELKRQRQLLYFTLGGFIITIFLTIFLLKVIRDKHKINLILEQQANNLKDKQNIINQKNKDLQESNEIKDKLFTIIGHDLRSPFANLNNMIDLMQSDDVSEGEFKEYLEHLRKRTDSTNILIDNLLNWAGTMREGNNTNKQNINLKNIADENIYLIKNTADEKEIKVINNLGMDEIVFADQDMIKLVIRNLITNAIKFTGRNGKISINSIIKNGEVEVSVSDSGVGMDEETIGKLFDRNQNYTTSGTEGEKGSGLGLRLCREFVERNGGRIWAESKCGEGSTFKFTLPKSEI